MKSTLEAALVEWAEPLTLIRRLESGMIQLSLAEYRELPKLFMDVWNLWRQELQQYQEEQKLKRKPHAPGNT